MPIEQAKPDSEEAFFVFKVENIFREAAIDKNQHYTGYERWTGIGFDYYNNIYYQIVGNNRDHLAAYLF